MVEADPPGLLVYSDLQPPGAKHDRLRRLGGLDPGVLIRDVKMRSADALSLEVADLNAHYFRERRRDTHRELRYVVDLAARLKVLRRRKQSQAVLFNLPLTNFRDRMYADAFERLPDTIGESHSGRLPQLRASRESSRHVKGCRRCSRALSPRQVPRQELQMCPSISPCRTNSVAARGRCAGGLPTSTGCVEWLQRRDHTCRERVCVDLKCRALSDRQQPRGQRCRIERCCRDVNLLS